MAKPHKIGKEQVFQRKERGLYTATIKGHEVTIRSTPYHHRTDTTKQSTKYAIVIDNLFYGHRTSLVGAKTRAIKLIEHGVVHSRAKEAEEKGNMAQVFAAVNGQDQSATAEDTHPIEPDVSDNSDFEQAIDEALQDVEENGRSAVTTRIVFNLTGEAEVDTVECADLVRELHAVLQKFKKAGEVVGEIDIIERRRIDL